jgi:PPOX class probable F420-dependent enzyme
VRLRRQAIECLLDSWPVARLATLTPDGKPHQVPVVFARVGEFLWSPVDAKPKAAGELARLRNVRANPAVSLLLDEYDADWSRLWWLRVDASARVAEPASAGAAPEIAAAVAALRRKYPQYGAVPVLRDPTTLLALQPTGLRSWCASRDAMPIC